MLRNTNRTLSVKRTEYGDMGSEKGISAAQRELFKAQARMTELDTLFRQAV